MCGVIGIRRNSGNVARLIEKGLYLLQHRGQESAGIALSSDGEMPCHRDLGLVSHVVELGEWRSLEGSMGVGHVRYSTKGSTTLENAAPMVVPSPIGPIAISYNGNLVNANHLRTKLAHLGFDFNTTTDTEIIALEIVNQIHQHGNMVDALKGAMEELQGAYSLSILTLNSLYAVRDPNGFRPLVLGEFDDGDGFVVASETCALGGVDAHLVREVANGEIIEINQDSWDSYIGKQNRLSLCVFCLIYMARPDSQLLGKSVYFCRYNAGQCLAEEESGRFDPKTTIVDPIKNTGELAGLGYAFKSGLVPHFGLIKDRYRPQRTFIRPDQGLREEGVDTSAIIPSVVAGLDNIAVDDSIVRGTTKRRTVAKFREAGARRVHVRIASPPYRFPCFTGIDTADQKELAAAGRSVEEIRQLIDADSLTYLSLTGLYQAIGLPQENFCDACLTGNYPIEIPEELVLSKTSLEKHPG